VNNSLHPRDFLAAGTSYKKRKKLIRFLVMAVEKWITVSIILFFWEKWNGKVVNISLLT
jgi:hypothetical protein